MNGNHRFITSAVYCCTLAVAPSMGTSVGIGYPGGTLNEKFCNKVVTKRKILARAIISPMHRRFPTPNGKCLSGITTLLSRMNRSGWNSSSGRFVCVHIDSSKHIPLKQAISIVSCKIGGVRRTELVVQRKQLGIGFEMHLLSVYDSRKMWCLLVHGVVSQKCKP